MLSFLSPMAPSARSLISHQTYLINWRGLNKRIMVPIQNHWLPSETHSIPSTCNSLRQYTSEMSLL